MAEFNALTPSQDAFRVLYESGLVQSTGFLYDEGLWSIDGNPTTKKLRTVFWSEMERRPPCLFIITAQNYPHGPDGFGKVTAWPEFDQILQTHYHLLDTYRPESLVNWEGHPTLPMAFELYVRDSQQCKLATSGEPSEVRGRAPPIN